MINQLRVAPVGSKVDFEGDGGYTIQARSDRFIVCTMPMMDTVVYTVADLEKGIRGTENLVFCAGFETRAKCEDAIQRLEGTAPVGDGLMFQTEVSYRNRVALKVTSVTPPEQQ